MPAKKSMISVVFENYLLRSWNHLQIFSALKESFLTMQYLFFFLYFYYQNFNNDHKNSGKLRFRK